MILHIDTAGSNATIALSDSGICLSMRQHMQPMEQAAMINIFIEEVLQETGVTANELSALTVNGGPGSYTGLRVGMSAAKGLCYALDIPLICCNRLQLIALDFLQGDDPVGVALSARQGEYFVAAFKGAGNNLLAPQHFFESALHEWLNQHPDLKLITDNEMLAAEFNAEMLPENYSIAIEKWIMLAEERLLNRQFDDVAYSEPFYLKPAYTTQSKK